MVVLFSNKVFTISLLFNLPEYLNSEFHNTLISVRNSSYAGHPVGHSSSLLMVFFEKLLISFEFWGWGLISV